MGARFSQSQKMDDQASSGEVVSQPITPQEGDLERLRETLWQSQSKLRRRSREPSQFPGRIKEEKRKKVKQLLSEKRDKLTPVQRDVLESRYEKDDPDSFRTLGARHNKSRQMMQVVEQQVLGDSEKKEQEEE